MQQMIVLGTGQAVCLHYHNTCFALENEQGYFLVDGGGGSDIIRCITETSMSWQKLHHAFLSHEHTDHLVGMIWVVRYIAELMNWGRYEGDFTLYTHDVAAEKLITICKMLLKPSQAGLIGVRIHVINIVDGQTVDVLGEHYTFFDIHSKKAKQFGFRLETKEQKSIVFLGDEPFNEQCSQYMTPCDWLLSEAFCLYSERGRYNPYELFHATVKEACVCAERFHAKNLVLWHTEDESTYGERKIRYTQEARHFFSGNVFVPDDYERIQFAAPQK